VVDAIRQGSQASGTSFDYLLATAKRESALDPSAKAGTSSATGLYQFIEQTWLGLVKSEGSKLGLSDYAGAITSRPDGTLTVADPGTRQAILKLREDPTLSATLAGTLAQKNGDSLAGEIGRQPTGGDLYVAHVLGARGAADLIKTADRNPARVAALDFPDAAAANRPIFYDKAGRPRGAAEVYGVLAAGQSEAAVTVAAPLATTGSTATGSTPLPLQSGPAMYGLFQTDARRTPVSDAVARIWRTNASNGGGQVVARSYFPRDNPASDNDQSAAAASPAPAAEVAPPVTTTPGPAVTATTNVPLPPPRPRTDTLQVQAAAGEPGRAPLNLLSYMKWRRP
jgi:hypothetical protein